MYFNFIFSGKKFLPCRHRPYHGAKIKTILGYIMIHNNLFLHWGCVTEAVSLQNMLDTTQR
jgi:hypothetical protein